MQLTELNTLDKSDLEEALYRCCGSGVWVEKMSSLFPVKNEQEIFVQAEKKWQECGRADWLEAFRQHPKIGDLSVLSNTLSGTSGWAAGEQASVSQASPQLLEDLLTGNTLYEERFGYLFIVFASGKSASEMFDLLRIRLHQSPEAEIITAMQEQQKIIINRLQKLLQS